MCNSFEDPLVEEKFSNWSADAERIGRRIRRLIFEQARKLPNVGPIHETLKWNQPSYLTLETGAGSTIRMDEIAATSKFGLYFHCQTTLVETFRAHYVDQLEFQKNRAIILETQGDLPLDALTHCIDLALTYHLKK